MNTTVSATAAGISRLGRLTTTWRRVRGIVREINDAQRRSFELLTELDDTRPADIDDCR